MKIKKFDVVELKNKDKATILNTDNNEYFAEIVDSNGTTIDKRNISQDEVRQVIYTKRL